jgi:two-component system, chemotaxis family, sensor kinase CheA
MLDEDVKDFLIESRENLETLDREIVELEQNCHDERLIASIFRTIHTIKGTCGFFGFSILGSITHIAENLLSQAREKQREVNPQLISLVLETVDSVKVLLHNIEESGSEGEDKYQDLRSRLERVCRDIRPHGENDGQPGESEGERAEKACQDGGASAASPEADQPLEASPADAAKTTETGAPAPRSGAEPRASHAPDTTIRVDVNLLDRLMNLVGELVLARNQLLQDASAFGTALAGTSQRLNLITSELQEGVMKTRMQPIGVVWNKLPRVVRDLARECGKRIEVEMDGSGTELDKTIIEAIKDPLTHIVRNSCDHGIEHPETRAQKGKPPLGRITLRAFHEGGHVNIEMSDDGAGVDAAKIKKKAIERGLISPQAAEQISDAQAVQLIFAPGFSTAEKVTSISGRGVGMDVVRTNIERIGGTVDVFNGVPCGTTVRIKIPLTLAIIPGLVVTLGGCAGKREQRFVIPQASLLELVRLEGSELLKRVQSVHGTPIYQHRGKLLPLVYLGRILDRPAAEKDEVNIVLLQAEDRQFGLVVDEICDTQEIVVKPLGKVLKGLSCYMGATIMGDGKVALILEIAGLARLAGIVPQSRQLASVNDTVAAQSTDTRQMLLLFRAGEFKRVVVPLSTVARLEKFHSSRVEHASGRPVIYYREQILPLVSLKGVLDPTIEDKSLTNEELQVVVFTHRSRNIGLVVDQIEDIIEESITLRRSSPMPGLLGSAVISEKITDVLDLRTIIKASGEDLLAPHPDRYRSSKRILLVDPSASAREAARSHLEKFGCEVHEAADTPGALASAAGQQIDLAVCALNPFSAPGRDFLRAFRKSPDLSQIPIVALLDEMPSELASCDELRGLGIMAWSLKGSHDDLQGIIGPLLPDAVLNGMANAIGVGE